MVIEKNKGYISCCVAVILIVSLTVIHYLDKGTLKSNSEGNTSGLTLGINKIGMLDFDNPGRNVYIGSEFRIYEDRIIYDNREVILNIDKLISRVRYNKDFKVLEPYVKDNGDYLEITSPADYEIYINLGDISRNNMEDVYMFLFIVSGFLLLYGFFNLKFIKEEE